MYRAVTLFAKKNHLLSNNLVDKKGLIKLLPNIKVDFVKNEHEILDYWSKNKTFEKLVEKNSNGPKWSFLDGPITANNPMGVHHAWGRTLKDLYQRR